jgi:CubicO group peptidase (beta-lactamase class C family)
MELHQYIDQRLAKPLGWGQWTWAMRRGENVLPHTPGGADIALRSTDHLRFLYAILKKGRWGNEQVIPADYIALCGKPTKWNTHAPMSLMWENNADGHVAGAPKDAFFKSGGGGYGVIVVPSLDLIIYKMAGDDGQYDPQRTSLKQDYRYDGSRDGWKAPLRSQFSDGPIGTDDGVRRVLEMVAAAVIDQ